MGKYSVGHPKANFGSYTTKFRKKPVKHFIEKAMLLNFLDLSTITYLRSFRSLENSSIFLE